MGAWRSVGRTHLLAGHLRDFFGSATMTGRLRHGPCPMVPPDPTGHLRQSPKLPTDCRMRFVHIADVHLDTPFSTRSPMVRKRLRAATRSAFSRAVELALQEQVDAFLIAGDLFDGRRVSFETESLLMEQLSRLAEAGVQVVYATGNHDPGAPGSRSLEMGWPDGVAVIPDHEPRRVAVRSRDGQPLGFVTAVGHASARETDDLSQRLPRPTGELPEVALLHTQVRGSLDEVTHEPYAPSVLGQLRTAGYHYWALGHVHLRQELSADPPIHYPGNVQGRNPREDGPRGCLSVDLSVPNRPVVRFHDLAPIRWARLSVGGLETCQSVEELVDRVAEAWEGDQGAADPEPEATLAQVTLSGPCPLWRALSLEDERSALGQAVSSRLGLLWCDVLAPGVHAVLDVDEHVERPDVLGEVLRLAAAIREGAEPLPEIPEHELALPHLEEVRDAQGYLRTLLPGAQTELLTRLWKQDGRAERDGR